MFKYPLVFYEVMKKEIIIGVITLTFLLLANFVLAQEGDSTSPVSTVTHFTNTNEITDVRSCNLQTKKAYLNYDDVVGHGNSKDSMSNIFGVRTILDNRAPNNGVPTDGAFDQKEEKWQTGSIIYFNLAEGNHILWGIATDSKGNNESISNANKCEFCIDTQPPPAPSKPVLSREEFCDPDYINSEDDDVTFTWTASDNGCAGISFFDVQIKVDREGIFTIFNDTSSNSFTVNDLQNGDMVRIKVRATDKAGNGPSNWSEPSEWITIDNIKPEVEITGPDNEGTIWYSGMLEITEIDEDENLFKCFYKVNVVNGETTIDWTETPCNEPLTIDTKKACPVDGSNICRVSKKAQDKACNEKERSKLFDIDNNAPKIDKIIDGPQYSNGTDSFVTTSSKITISATDEASGVKTLCYSINGNEPNCSIVEDGSVPELSIKFSFKEESEHTLSISVVDNVGNANSTQQTHFVDDTPPITNKTYINFFQEIGTWFIEHLNINIVNFIYDWLGSSSQIILTAIDPEPEHASGVSSTMFKILALSEDLEKGEEEFYGKITGKWYESEDECVAENPTEMAEPEPTPSPIPNGENAGDNGNNVNAQNGGENNCIKVESWITLEENQYNAETGIMPGEIEGISEGANKVCFKSKDNLGNEEKEKCQVFFFDKTAPNITIFNPNKEETTIQRCTQSIVALVKDNKGVKRVWAELWNSSNDKVREVNMVLRPDGTYDALMDKQLPSGDYKLIVKAEDNMGNVAEESLGETLVSTVFVEFISPAICALNPEQGGQCNFRFNVCMRDANKVSFSLDKLGGIVTPGMMDAKISKGQETAFVGLLDEGINSGVLNLSTEIINGRTNFDLHLDIPSNVSSQIGAGSHNLNYSIKSFR